MGMNTTIIHSTLSQLSQRLQDGELTSTQIMQAFLDRIAQTEPAIHAFLSLAGEQALDQARALDRHRS